MREFDVLVVGSGFGGSVAALRATEKGYRVGVLEAGRRWEPEDFPATNWNLRRFLWAPRLGCHGIQRLTLLGDVLVLSGAGVGGGSLVYANVLHEPLEGFWRTGGWSGITSWRDELAPYYELARRMLGTAQTPFESKVEPLMREVAARLGAEETFQPTEVGVWFGEPGQEVPDPYFGGAGPLRRGCIRCGGCIVGCRFHAKNTLDRNYLWLAERGGAEVLPERTVVDLRRLNRGWEVEAEMPRGRETFLAPELVLAAGTLGTLRLLLEARERGRLPGLSPRLGEFVRTNSEAIVGAAAVEPDPEYALGIAIGSEFRPELDTHVQPVRYPRGSNLMGLLGTVLVDGGPGIPRQLRFLGRAARRPLVFLRSLSVRRWSERTVILLVMQSRDNSLRVGLAKRRLGRGFRLASRRGVGEPNPTFLPLANRVARETARLLGGYPGSSLNEVLLDVPTTAHILGGAAIGAGPAEGVVDPYLRVHGCPGLHVLDGAAVSANPGANPALTIAAQAERALALWPNRGDEDPRPRLGGPYEPLEPVPARAPAF